MIPTRHELIKFYKNHFSLDALRRVINEDNIETREFAFKYSVSKESVDRPLCFDSLEKLKNYMTTHGPNKSYVGGFYERRFPRDKTAQQSIRESEWRGREVCFDIDMDHYMSVREDVCDCGSEKKICNDCLGLAKAGVSILTETLCDGFGFKREDIVVLFSGRQGFHVWVPSCTRLFKNEIGIPPRYAKKREKEIRQALAEYIQLISEKQQTRRKNGKKIVKHSTSVSFDQVRHPMRRRIFSEFVKMLMRTPLKKLEDEMNVEKKLWERLRGMHRAGRAPLELWHELRKQYSPSKRERLFSDIVKRCFPRYDIGCTKDVDRIMKIPGSVDGSTGNLCMIVDDLEAFSLHDVPTIWDFIEKR